MKVRDLIRQIEDDGWRQIAQRGSHRQYKHHGKPGKVTIAGAPSDDVHPKTLSSVLKQAGLKSKCEGYELGDEEKILGGLRGRRQQPEWLLAGRTRGRFDSNDAGADATNNAGGCRVPFGSSCGRWRSNSRACNNERGLCARRSGTWRIVLHRRMAGGGGSAISIGGVNRRSLDFGGQKRVASARDDNKIEDGLCGAAKAVPLQKPRIHNSKLET